MKLLRFNAGALFALIDKNKIASGTNARPPIWLRLPECPAGNLGPNLRGQVEPMPSRTRHTASNALSSVGAELVRTAHMASGVTISEWHGHDALLEYQTLPRHVLSISLSGGRRCRHVKKGKPRHHGFDSSVCLFPAGGSVSQWAIAAPLDLLHIGFDQSSLLKSVGTSLGTGVEQYQFREVFQERCPVISAAAHSIAHADWADAALSPGIDGLLSWILLNAVRIYAITCIEPRDPRGCFAADQSQLIVDYLGANVANAIQLDELARHFHLSRYHFLRKFKNTFGIPPHAYLTGIRMERARQLLGADGAKVSAIALECGYSQPSQFASAFKRHFGYSPHEMKRRK